MIEIIGAPFDLCGFQPGSRLGPAAIRLAGLRKALLNQNVEVMDAGDVPATNVEHTEEGGLDNFGPLLNVIRELRRAVERSLANGHLPIVVGGEHTLVVGGIAAARHQFGASLGVLWIDAHADINTPGTSLTGHIHGMPLAALHGSPSEVSDLRDAQWQELLDALGPDRLDSRNVAWFGLRDVDPEERAKTKIGLPVSMHDIDRKGIEASVARINEYFRQLEIRHLWISFDVDALDPILAPGTGTAVRGGLTYRESHLMAELLHEALAAPDCPYRLVGVDVVETNPLTDNNNQTAIMAVEWIASLFGKTILGE